MTTKPPLFSGSITALVTPFREGKLDEAAFQHLIERQIEGGTHAIVPMGTTGEAPTLSVEEHVQVVKLAVAQAKGRVKVIAGAGSNDTASSIAMVRAVAEIGADGVLCATGYYNKPTQAGLIAHFEAVSDASPLPIILYNVPGRTVADLSVETVAHLSQRDNIVAIKDATGDLARLARQRVACGPDFIQLSGEDITALAFNASGGVGCISVTANLVPTVCADLQNKCAAGNWTGALAIQDRLVPLHDALFCETSPAPIKYALSRLGLCTDEVRLPLAPLSAPSKARIDKVLEELGLL